MRSPGKRSPTRKRKKYTVAWWGDLLIIGEQTEKLSKLESKIFLILCKNRNKLTSRKLLLTVGWYGDDSSYHLQLNKIINKLRNLLKSTDEVSITTDKGNGYWLITG